MLVTDDRCGKAPTHFQLREFETTEKFISFHRKRSIYDEGDIQTSPASAIERHAKYACFKYASALSARKSYYSQVRIDTGDVGLAEGIREGREPAFRLPLHRVITPDGFVSVARVHAKQNRRALGNRDLRKHLSIVSDNRLRER